jgi:hypothetical protein
MRPHPSAAEQAIVRDYYRREQLRRQLRQAEDRQGRLTKRLAQLAQRYEDVRWLTEIYRGVPLRHSRDNLVLFGTADNRRQASYYRVVNHPRAWGLNVEEGSDFRRHCGHRWPSLEAVLAAAREWVACGCVPPMNGGLKEPTP